MDVGGLEQSLEEYALMLKAKLPPEHQAIIDALVMAADVKQNRYPPRTIVARLRGASMSHMKFSPVIATHMEMIANQLESKR